MKRSIKISDRKIILLVVDLTIILATTLFGLWTYARGFSTLTFNFSYLADQIGWLLLLSSLWMFSAYLNGLYDPIKSATLDKTILLLLRSGTIVMVVYLLVFFYTAPTILLPRGIVVYQVISGFVLISIWRISYIYLAESTRFKRKILIIGAGWAGKTIAQAILKYASNQYQIVGFIDDDPALSGKTVEIPLSEEDYSLDNINPDASESINIPVLGSAENLIKITNKWDIPEVVLAITTDINSATFRSLMDCKELAIDISLMSELYENLTGRIPVEHIGDNWFVSLPMDSAETSIFYSLFSRIFDILSASIGLIFLLPFFPLIALVIYLDSPGPIFYMQERVGKKGKKFNLYKLRTMIPDAEIDGKAQRALQNDPRVTRVGKWLRKFRLDEMPQLFNVLSGDMSAVGPRPERPSHLIELDKNVPFHRLRNAVKPGMAGWAVINFGYIDDLESARLRLQYDLYYVKHQSIMLDLIILIRTFGQIFLLRGR